MVPASKNQYIIYPFNSKSKGKIIKKLNFLAALLCLKKTMVIPIAHSLYYIFFLPTQLLRRGIANIQQCRVF